MTITLSEIQRLHDECVSEEWSIVRWHHVTGENAFKCGPISTLGEMSPDLKLAMAKASLSNYGFPRGGHTGKLVLFHSKGEAQKAIDDGKFDGCATNSHTVESLGSMRFRVTAGSHVLGSPRDVDATGSYWMCLHEYAWALMVRSSCDVRIEYLSDQDEAQVKAMEGESNG